MELVSRAVEILLFLAKELSSFIIDETNDSSLFILKGGFSLFPFWSSHFCSIDTHEKMPSPVFLLFLLVLFFFFLSRFLDRQIDTKIKKKERKKSDESTTWNFIIWQNKKNEESRLFHEEKKRIIPSELTHLAWTGKTTRRTVYCIIVVIYLFSPFSYRIYLFFISIINIIETYFLLPFFLLLIEKYPWLVQKNPPLLAKKSLNEFSITMIY